MEQESISESIIKKFSESLKEDTIFNGISEDLITLVNKEKCSKTDIEKLLQTKQNENS